LMRVLLRAGGLVAAVVLVLSSQAGCTAERSQPNELKMIYLSGVGDDRKFERCIAPGTTGDWAADNDVFTLPADRRTWNVQPTVGSDETAAYVVGSAPQSDPASGKSRSGPQMAVWFTTDFYLNWDCKFDYTRSLQGQKGEPDSPVVTFFNRTGRTAEISDDGGDFNADAWRALLLKTMAVAERDVLQSQSKLYGSDQLKDNLGDVYELMEAQLAPALQAKLKEKAGGNYFCGIEFDGGKTVKWREPVLDDSGRAQLDPVTKLPVTVEKSGTCPPVRIDITNIDLANSAQQAAADQVYIAEEQAKAANTKAKSDKQVAELAKDPNVMRLKQMENERQIAEACANSPHGSCTLIQGVSPGSVDLPAGTRR
jgi:hypothetical protein